MAVEGIDPIAASAITLDASQERALGLFGEGSNVALFGRAGCGKSEVLRRMIASAVAKWGSDAVAVAALAGSAALLVGGQTLHSLFGMNTRRLSRETWLRETLLRPQVCARLNALRVLCIDEVCTLSSSLFSRLGYVMRRVAPPHMQHLPFGGCQLVGAGDPLQVAPVHVTDESMDRMVFDCFTWRSVFDGGAGKVACLTGAHRQAQDATFQNALDRVRWGRADRSTIELFNATSSATFSAPATKLRILKSAVQDINHAKLATLPSLAHVFVAHDVMLSTDPQVMDEALTSLRSCVDVSFSVKVDAPVILTRKVDGVAPGTRGIVRDVIQNSVIVEDEEVLVESVMCDFAGVRVGVGRVRFSAYDHTGTEVAYSEQVPLLLGWALTVHRSQGLTLDAVEIDFTLDSWTTCGLVYTALSRVRSFAALRVSGLRRDLIRASRCALAYYEKKLVEEGINPVDDGRPPVVG